MPVHQCIKFPEAWLDQLRSVERGYWAVLDMASCGGERLGDYGRDRRERGQIHCSYCHNADGRA